MQAAPLTKCSFLLRASSLFRGRSHAAHCSIASALSTGSTAKMDKRSRRSFPVQRGGLPAAPGAQLDNDLVQQALARGTPVQPRPSLGPRLATTANTCTTAASAPTQPFDAYVILDFEATCEEGQRILDPEVIEFPFIIVDPVSCSAVAEFQRYVRPLFRPQLSAFCTSLTGIQQAVVDQSADFPQVFREALLFLEAAGLGDAPPLRSYCIVTCGDWDLQTMLPAQLRTSGGDQRVPASFGRWCNIKKCVAQLNPPLPGQTQGGHKRTPGGMVELLNLLNLPLRGRHHSGIDDCRNIAAIVCDLMKRGYLIDTTHEPATTTSNSNGPPSRRWRAPASASLPPWSSLQSSIASDLAKGTTPNLDARAAAAPRVKSDRAGKPKTSTPARSGTSASAATTPSILDGMLVVDPQRNALDVKLLPQPTTAVERSPNELRTISKYLSLVLRHQAPKLRLRMSQNGYVLVSDLLKLETLRRKGVTPAELVQIVVASDKQRYRMAYGSDDGLLYITATQGHSIEGVFPDLHIVQHADEVPVAVHGTYREAWKAILQCGYLSTMTRQHIHFAQGILGDEGVISGMRKTVEVFAYLDVAAVLASGIALYQSSNGVLLTPGVDDTRKLPLKYVSKAVDRVTGEVLYTNTQQ